MATWRYVFADLLTDRTIDELDVTGVTFDDRIIVPGAFKGTIAVPSRAVAARARQIEEGRTVVYAYRGADIWGGPYLLWQVTPTSTARGDITVDLQGATLESYLEHREIRSTLAFVGQDQLDIFRALILDVQDRDESNLGITVDATLSGVARDRTYLDSEGATYGQRAAELANVLDGFEYRIVAYVDPAAGTRVRKAITGYPELGQGVVDHVFTEPGDVLSWKRVGDASKAATSFRATGDPVNDDVSAVSVPTQSVVVERADLLAAGWPLLDRTDAYQSVTDEGTLDGYAASLAARYGGSRRILSVTVRLGSGPDVFTPANLGDRARVVLDDVWFTTVDGDGRRVVFSEAWRVVGMGVTPTARGQGQDTAQLIFATEGP